MLHSFDFLRAKTESAGEDCSASRRDRSWRSRLV